MLPDLVGALEELIVGCGDALDDHVLYALEKVALLEKQAPGCGTLPRILKDLPAWGGKPKGFRKAALDAASAGAVCGRELKAEYIDQRVYQGAVLTSSPDRRERVDPASPALSAFSALCSPPSPVHAHLTDLDYCDFARVGTWNMWGNCALKARHAEPPAAALEGAGEAVTAEEYQRWSSPENARSKVAALAELIRSQRLTVCALQEVPAASCLPALAQEALPTWSFCLSARIGAGLFKCDEAAAFGFDCLAWEPVAGGGGAAGEASALLFPTTLFPFTRAPALIFLRSRVHPTRVLALVSSHHKSMGGSPAVRSAVEGEAAALHEHVLPWAQQQAGRLGLNWERDVCVVFAGDYNLKPPPGNGEEGGGAHAAAPSPFAQLLRSNFTPALTQEMGLEQRATNLVALFTSGAHQTYDNIFCRCPWAAVPRSGVREERVVDITSGRYSSAAAYLRQIVGVTESIRRLAREPKHSALCALVGRLQEAVGSEDEALRQAEFRRFRAALSDHLPLCITVCAGAAAAAGGGNLAEALEAAQGER